MITPMLARATEDCVALCKDDRWVAEQKLDGVRCMVHVGTKGISFVSRNSRALHVDPGVAKAFQPLLGAEWVLDGEYFDRHLWLFDVPHCPRLDVRTTTPWGERRHLLDQFFAHYTHPQVHEVQVASTHEQKVALVKAVHESGGEGVVFKRRSAAYQSGKTNDVLKFKFVKDVDCVVTRLNVDGKDNFAVAVFRNGELVEVGEVTRWAGDGQLVKVGDVVTVKYLAFTADHRLREATLPRVRTDKDPEECGWDQLTVSRSKVVV